MMNINNEECSNDTCLSRCTGLLQPHWIRERVDFSDPLWLGESRVLKMLFYNTDFIGCFLHAPLRSEQCPKLVLCVEYRRLILK